MIEYGVPNQRAAEAYLRRFVMNREVDSAATVWSCLVARGHVDERLAGDYVELVLREKGAEAAAEAWASNTHEDGNGYPDANRAFNGGFERVPVPARFDWQMDGAPGATLALDRTIRHSGQQSVRIQFDGEQNVGAVGLAEYAFLHPGRYRLRAFVRTDGISTDQGVHIRVREDDNPKAIDLSTTDLRGTHDWTAVEGEFEARSGALVHVSVERTPSLKFDNRVAGSAWVDDVSLVRVDETIALRSSLD